MNELIQLSPFQLLLALGMIVMAIALSIWQRLGLEWNLAIGAGRTILQLLAVGYVLAIVFTLRNPWAVLAILLVMLSVATVVARNRISKKLPFLIPVIGGALFVSTAITLGYVNFVVLRPAVWYEPQYVIPIAGMLMGNAMNAGAIAGERFVSAITQNRLAIETHLCLGAMPRQAIAAYRQEAIKAGLIPIINAMTVVGIVTLPGIITGQLLSGIDPLNAAFYQMLIMFMLAFVDLLSVLLMLEGIYRQCFTPAAQLKLPR
jgi:putative ABC transport system permease protein